MKKKIRLVSVSGGVPGESFLFEEDEIKEIQIGRALDNTVVLPDADSLSSRKHGKIQITEDGIWLADHSANGTWIDNHKISNSSCMLDTGEYAIRFGQSQTKDYFKLIIEEVVEEEEEALFTAACSDDGAAELETYAGFLETGVFTKESEKIKTPDVDFEIEAIVEAETEGFETEELEIEELEIETRKPQAEEEIVQKKQSRFGFDMELSVVDDEIEEFEDTEEIDVDMDFKFNLEQFLDFGDRNRDNSNQISLRLRSIDYGWGKEFKNMGEINKGGFGSVRKVQNVKTKQIYALKEVNAPDDFQMVKWFKREAALGQQLSHPRIIEVFDADLDDEKGKYRFLMEYCEGGDLGTWMKKKVKKGQGISLKQATSIVLHILEGLEYLEDVTVQTYDRQQQPISVKGVVHRDIKPANIFLMKEDDIDSLKIGDLGTAKGYLSGDTRAVEHIHSDYYAPKKQVMRGGYSEAGADVDVFATAAIFYELLTGYKIRSNERGEWSSSNPILPVKKLNPKVPDNICRIIDAVLAEDTCMEPDQTTSASAFRKQILREVR